MTASYLPGEHLAINVPDATVVETLSGGDVVVDVPVPDRGEGEVSRIVVPTGIAGVTIRRMAPPEWPPLAGDIWRDSEDDIWLCTYSGSLINKGQSYMSAYVLLEGRGPLKLVHRQFEPPPDAEDDRPNPDLYRGDAEKTFDVEQAAREGESNQDCYECESTGTNCRAHRTDANPDLEDPF